MPTPWRVFIINGCWILSKAFSASVKMIFWFLFFILLMWCIILIDLQILKNPCIHEINSTWSWCIILFMFGGVDWLVFYWGFCIYVHQWYWPIIYVFFVCVCVVSLSGFAIMVIVASYNQFGSILSSAFFWNSFRRIHVNNSCLNVC